MAEILSTLLAGGLPTMLDPTSGSKNHFAAYNIAAFTDVAQFKATMDQMLETLRTTEPAHGHDRVLYPGLSEYEEVQERRAHGIPLHKEVIQWFNSITSELGLAPLATLGKQ
jgi:LDH2 family malate/lactate/ureidoglycolate dehydrogenase